LLAVSIWGMPLGFPSCLLADNPKRRVPMGRGVVHACTVPLPTRLRPLAEYDMGSLADS
jgi:hypothetical protein